jgi:N-acetylmuramoyl-L-alanine amidase
MARRRRTSRSTSPAASVRALGGKAILTPSGDVFVPLANRAAVATALRADLFVSVDLNSMPTPEQRRNTSGIETYFLSADATDGRATAVAARENADRLAAEGWPCGREPS